MSYYYHVYNRGTNKCNIVRDTFDLERFQKSLQYFNTQEPIGSIFEEDVRRKRSNKSLEVRLPNNNVLVKIEAFIVNPNHYHLLLCVDEPEKLSKFLQRLNTGYTKYFNNRYGRSGALFQGKTKKDLIKSDAKLNYIKAYILYNDLVHGLSSGSLVKSSRSQKGRYSSGILADAKSLAKSVAVQRGETNYYVIEKFGSRTSK